MTTAPNSLFLAQDSCAGNRVAATIFSVLKTLFSVTLTGSILVSLQIHQVSFLANCTNILLNGKRFWMVFYHCILLTEWLSEGVKVGFYSCCFAQ
jgi:hypothetical protein